MMHNLHNNKTVNKNNFPHMLSHLYTSLLNSQSFSLPFPYSPGGAVQDEAEVLMLQIEVLRSVEPPKWEE